MKPKRRRRQIFVFTAEEKKVAACIVAALALGLATRHYRITHPTPPRALTAAEVRAEKAAQHKAGAKERSARTAQALAQTTPVPTESEDDDD